MTKKPAIERFTEKRRRTDCGCWHWKGYKNPKGYGTISVNGRIMMAHRFAYDYCVGPIPDGMHVLHRCDNPSCVNPEHLFLGTNADNVADKMKKQRQASVLTAEQAVEIVEISNAGLFTHREIADKYGISIETVSRVITGYTWGHATGIKYCAIDKKGENIKSSKLTEESVREIRSLHASGGITNTEIAKRYGVTGSLVGMVVKRQIWKHVK